MTAIALPAPVFRAVDANGVPYNGARLQFYLTGTTTPTPVYTSSSLGTPLANPVVSDSAGLFAPIFLDPASTYRMQLLTSAGALIQDIDPVAAPFAIGANTVTNAMLQAGVALANLGYMPLNKAGDTATNLLLVNTSLATISAGYLGLPVNTQNANYTLVLADAGKLIRGSNAGAFAYTIPTNASVAFPIGTAIVIRNIGVGVNTLTRAGGVTQTIAGAGTSKDVALAQWAFVTLVLEAADTWCVSGQGAS